MSKTLWGLKNNDDYLVVDHGEYWSDAMVYFSNELYNLDGKWLTIYLVNDYYEMQKLQAELGGEVFFIDIP